MINANQSQIMISLISNAHECLKQCCSYVLPAIVSQNDQNELGEKEIHVKKNGIQNNKEINLNVSDVNDDLTTIENIPFIDEFKEIDCINCHKQLKCLENHGNQGRSKRTKSQNFSRRTKSQNFSKRTKSQNFSKRTKSQNLCKEEKEKENINSDNEYFLEIMSKLTVSNDTQLHIQCKCDTCMKQKIMELNNKPNKLKVQKNILHQAHQVHNIPILLIIIFLLCICKLKIVEGAAIAVAKPIFGCFPCMKMMNREWKHNLDGACHGTIEDCGKCLEGYLAYNKEEKCRANDKAKMVEKNSDIAHIHEGDSIIIKCTFDIIVNCIWNRNGDFIDIGGRYSYVNNNGMQTKDCSIRINPIDGLDFGRWYCESIENSDHKSILSTNVLLVGANVTTVESDYQTAHIQEGGTVIIRCKFDNDVNCVWNRKENFVDISDRYSYIHNDGRKTNDCSIRISPVQEIDFGRWYCESTEDSSHYSIQSRNVVLIEVKPVSMKVSPEDTSFYIGDKAVLQCEFDAEIPCNWQLNGKDLQILDRYQYQQGDGNQVGQCSIEIDPVTIDDEGKWYCYSPGMSLPPDKQSSVWLTVYKNKMTIEPFPSCAMKWLSSLTCNLLMVCLVTLFHQMHI